MNISYINMCKLNKNSERREAYEREREREREVGVCGCNFVLFIWKNRITTGLKLEVYCTIIR
jgi:hypothetical protein